MNYSLLTSLLTTICGSGLITGTVSCVSQNKYTTLQTQYTDVAWSRDQLQVEKTVLLEEKARNKESLRTSLLSKNQ
ncbi:hypothetical protein [Hymenobacter swuensis]|uniref:Uncharacterized protein n=1 Tax=Hymenobacter swuensis DY53 TaxID=1227739 RepID=W8F0N6_9BACT|nr:hypothetical protein [Hymenobacter swuensis]AHJ97587.1 hypothetical protein Hsw_1992 [Hymenobacter swuensis DY53]